MIIYFGSDLLSGSAGGRPTMQICQCMVEEYSSLERLFIFSLNLKTFWLVNSILQIDPVTEWHGTPSAVIWSRENRLMLLVFPFFSPISTRHWRWKSCQVSLLANANLNVFFWAFLLSLSLISVRKAAFYGHSNGIDMEPIGPHWVWLKRFNIVFSSKMCLGG